MTILAIGDSNTYGYDPRSCLGSRYPAEIRWTDRLPGRRVINKGLNGRTVPEDAADDIDQIRAEAPELVTVMLGTNDVLRGVGAEETARRMEAFLTALLRLDVPILLIAPPPLCPGAWVESEAQITESGKLAELYRALARRLGAAFADAGEWNVALTFDGVHFSPDGHTAFARGLTETLDNLQKELLH